ncbi:hypothetical protein CHLRE_03g176450v5 [Chlamydomonas reinhardtii]|uniref:Uncharacterized protein n=1 Tax=Chlamydomonas reinhardtii TaxID=3055 RepID=A0A2K3DXF4_CHLRE|nr:uncharacterized protein CHLRE_03g176450v5 [Chlamydomonas reinhardtii]PNW85214.1 hypothetical protein CHLRE_03g176450v5 [Chlamydomonas reinhardtii]
MAVRLRVAEIRAEAHVRAAEVTAEQHRRHLRDFRTCAWLIGGLTGGLTGAILVGYPIRELYNKVCAALDAVARQAVDPIRAAINAHAAAIAGVLTTSWLVARDWPLRLCNGVAGGVAYCLVAARQRRLQGAAARR